MPEIVDDKSQYCIPFILERLRAHQEKHAGDPNPPPFFLGMNGVQGAGKTVLVSIIQNTLQGPPHDLPTAVLSADDLYLTHKDQVKLAQANPENPLLQHRGQPSTHDLPLGLEVFSSLRAYRPTKIPEYNKAAFDGHGDRVPSSEWQEVNQGDKKIKVLLYEGWCVGFRPLEDNMLRQTWENAVKQKEAGQYIGRLGYNKLDDVKTINEALRSYDSITDQLDALIHIDAEDLQFVYKWRLQQEVGLRALKGTGMTDEQVKNFVDGYYPSYELFALALRQGVFTEKGKQLRLIVGEDRKVREVLRL